MPIDRTINRLIRNKMLIRNKGKENTMPHVELTMLPGRTEEQKQAIADAFTKIVNEIAKPMAGEDAISVVIKDCADEDWKEQVWDAKIVPDEEFLYKKPGYSYDE